MMIEETLVNSVDEAGEGMAWPGDQAKLDLSDAQPDVTGRGRCTGIWLTDEAGNARRSFEQGERANFYYEFELDEDVEIPVAGVMIRGDQEVPIHGKTSFQFESVTPAPGRRGTRLRFRQGMKLELTIGDYTFDVGLSEATRFDFENRSRIPTGTLYGGLKRVCRVSNAGGFTVGERPLGTEPVPLSFHGLVDLPGDLQLWGVHSGAPSRSVGSVDATEAAPVRPTIVHVTHWKAGSQWIHKILCDCVPRANIVPPQVDETQFLKSSILPGKVYPTVYVTRQAFEMVKKPERLKYFVVIRDLRDTLVSGYFSFRKVHPLLNWGLGRIRATLEQLDLEEGLVYLMDNWLAAPAAVQASWLGYPVIRYKDLLADDEAILERTLIDECGLEIERERLREIVRANRFESLTGGRQRGEADESAHERKGIAGDWRNYFTDRVTEAFKLRYGGVLVAAGFEQDDGWSA